MLRPMRKRWQIPPQSMLATLRSQHEKSSSTRYVLCWLTHADRETGEQDTRAMTCTLGIGGRKAETRSHIIMHVCKNTS
jgi:hypothetical protein